MSKFNKGEASAKAEIALMSKVIAVTCQEELSFILDYIMEVLVNSKILSEKPSAKEIIEESNKYNKDKVTYITLNMLDDMVLITMVKDKPENLLSYDGAFSYVYNITAPFCSELGYSFFRRQSTGMVVRVA